MEKTFINQNSLLRKEEAEVLNEELRKNYQEEYHWLNKASCPLVVALLPGGTHHVPVEVLAVKVPVSKNYGLMVRSDDGGDIYEVGYGDVDNGDVSTIIQGLP